MPLWLIFVIVGQFLNAAVSLVDKFIVTSKKVPASIIYAFMISSLSIFSLFIFFIEYLPLGNLGVNLPTLSAISYPGWPLAMLSLLVGITFVTALFFLYSALEKADASDVIPVVGAVSAVFTLVLSHFIFQVRFTNNFVIGFILLVIGTFVVSHFRFSYKILTFTIISGIFMAVHFFFSKFIFLEWGFDNAFFWSRIGLAISALSLFIWPAFRKHCFLSRKTQKGTAHRSIKNILLVLANACFAGVAGILLLKAIDLGDVAVVQALGGLQFVFIALLSFVLGNITPSEFGENNKIEDMVQKFIAIVIISTGFSLLFI